MDLLSDSAIDQFYQCELVSLSLLMGNTIDGVTRDTSPILEDKYFVSSAGKF